MPDVRCQTPACQDTVFLQSACLFVFFHFFQSIASAKRTFGSVTVFWTWGYSVGLSEFAVLILLGTQLSEQISVLV